MSSVAPPNQKCEAPQPIRYDPITIQLCTLGDNCNDMLCGSRFRTFSIRMWTTAILQNERLLCYLFHDEKALLRIFQDSEKSSLSEVEDYRSLRGVPDGPRMLPLK